MKIIKISAGTPEKRDLLLRQTPDSKGIWNDCRFVVNDKIEKCDWWFVLHGSGLTKHESCFCDPNHIVYVSMEPTESMSQVSDKFLEQFSCLVICDRYTKHRNIIYSNWLTWWVGIIVTKTKKEHVFNSKPAIDYNQFLNKQPMEKINRISVIVSNKDFSNGHKKRIEFLNAIIESPISQYIDIFGHGYKSIPDKWDAISAYKYHLVIENSVQKDYWSEKLADAFLGFSFPIYYGCPNVYDYFSENSLCIIDISNINQIIEVLKHILCRSMYEDSLQEIKRSRDQVLNQYNIFNLMSELAVDKASKYEKISLDTNAFYKDSVIKKIAKFLLSKISQ